MKFNEATYRTPCNEAGYIVRFEDGSASIIVAYHGLHEGVYGETITCDTCPNKEHCELMDYRFESVDIVCGWDAADELLHQWEYEPDQTESAELDDLLHQLS